MGKYHEYKFVFQEKDHDERTGTLETISSDSGNKVKKFAVLYVDILLER